MDYIVINLKEFSPSVDIAIANFEIEIERAKNSNIKAIKFIHGYGSHGHGGLINAEIQKLLPIFKKRKKIKDYIHGNEWNIGNTKAQEVLYSAPSSAYDVDLNHSNPGITIIYF